MIRRLLFLSVLLLGLNMVLAKNDWKFRSMHKRQYSPNKEQMRTLRNLMGKLIDTETNTLYTMDGEKQQDVPLDIDSTPPPPSPSVPVSVNAPVNFGEIACLAACHTCVEADSFESRKKKAADNCGPMCDCADSCFLMPAEEVGQIFGQPSNHRQGKDCWWKTYTEMLGNGLATSS